MSSVNTAPCPPRSSGSLSCNVTTVTAVISAMTFSASGAAPTPLYQEYQSHFGLTPFMVTVIFAAYVLCLLLALLTVGSLSDYIGRRPAILSALAMNVVAMLIFMTAGSLERWSSRARCRALRPDSRQRPSGPPCGDFARHHKSIVAIENSTVIYGLLACI
jgi:MFS family permease